MTRAELKRAIELAEDYYNEICKNDHDGTNESVATEEWYDFMRKFDREGVYERGLIASVVYNGLRAGLKEVQIAKMLEIAGILEEENV